MAHRFRLLGLPTHRERATNIPLAASCRQQLWVKKRNSLSHRYSGICARRRGQVKQAFWPDRQVSDCRLGPERTSEASTIPSKHMAQSDPVSGSTRSHLGLAAYCSGPGGTSEGV